MTAPDYISLPDSELIMAALDRKDSQAWEALILRYQRLIYSIPLRYGLSENDAADIFQTVCLLLLENLAYLRNRERLGVWFVITTRRECWRLGRQRQRGVISQDLAQFENQLTDGLALEQGLLDLERQVLLRSAMERLDARCQRLLKLLFYTEPRPSYSEIVRILALPEGSIGPTRARCLEKLSKVLEDMGVFD
ncbi:MAG TPA: sigma-70 family RNA polymerase sigma factor [Anaerolineae bacterium]|nr:sigma-70 family RNA polymerase sigma factor [Anaerolineae bacterium]